MRRYPDSNGCTLQEKHILGPWSSLDVVVDYKGESYSIQWAECCRCGYVTHNVVPGSAKQINAKIASAIAVQRADRYMVTAKENQEDPSGPNGEVGS